MTSDTAEHLCVSVQTFRCMSASMEEGLTLLALASCFYEMNIILVYMAATSFQKDCPGAGDKANAT